jgi:serine/threonine-protein kinase
LPAPVTWTCPRCGGTYPDDFAVCPRDATPRADQATPTGDPLIGAVLAGSYRIVRVLGEGGMARLYAAEHVRVDRRYAVKIMHDDLVRFPELLARFEREARAVGKVRSRNVVDVVDVLRTGDGRPCIVTELLDGEDLQAHLNRVGRMAPAAAIPIVRQMCAALAAAHACGVVHRDLKPSNVFLCRGDDLVVKVLDFGVAKLDDDHHITQTGALVGTPAYMAPEQARRAADAGPLADIYSLGAVLFRMVTGEPPYGRDPAVNPLALLLAQEPARPRALEPSIPEGVEAVIQHAMARDPEARPASAEELDGELAAFAHEAPPPAAPLAAVPTDDLTLPTAARIARRATLARPVAALLLAAGGVAAAMWATMLLAAIVAAATAGERTLIAVVAAATGALVAVFHLRAVAACWRSATALIEHNRVVARALVLGVGALGALELAAAAAAVWAGAMGGRAWRVAAAGLVAGVTLAWPRIRRRPRVRALMRRWGL